MDYSVSKKEIHQHFFPIRNFRNKILNKISKECIILSCRCIGKKTTGSKLVAQNVQPNRQNGGKIGQVATQNGKGNQASGNQGKY